MDPPRVPGPGLKAAGAPLVSVSLVSAFLSGGHFTCSDRDSMSRSHGWERGGLEAPAAAAPHALPAHRRPSTLNRVTVVL